MSRLLLATLIVLLATSSPVFAQSAGLGPDRLYGTAEYLLWWLKDSPTPVPLVNAILPPDGADKRVLGGNDFDSGEHHGGRFTLGYWFTEDHAWGLEASYFFIPETTSTKSVTSSGAPGSLLLYTPFACVSDCGPNPVEEIFPHAIPGAFGATAREQMVTSMRGGDLSVAHRLAGGSQWRVELLGGFRYFNLQEKYIFSVNSPLFPPVPGDLFQYSDSFDARNDFYGGQLGVRGQGRQGRWFINGGVKVGLGVMRQRVDVAGGFATTENSPNFGFQGELLSFGAIQTFPGGVFAQPSNIGRHKQDVFAVVPEANLNVGFDITPWMSVFVGYTFLYSNNVVRPAKQIDRNINPSQSVLFDGPGTTLTGAAVPAFKFRTTDFWTMGLNVGLTLRY